MRFFRRNLPDPVLCAVPAVLLGGLFWHRLLWMCHLWWSDGLYSLSALVPLVSLGVVYTKWNKLSTLPRNPSPGGAVAVIAVAAVTVAADRLQILKSLTPLLLVAMLCGIVLALWGYAALKELFFPIAFLLLLVPIPPILLEKIDLPLQIMCAKAVEGGSRLAGLHAQRVGSILVFPGSDAIDVVPACNGVRSAVTMLMLSIICAYLSRAPWYSKLAVVMAAVPIAYFANLVRLFGIVSGAHFLGGWFMNHEQAFDHVFGLFVFCGCVALLLLWARLVKCTTFVETY